MPNVNIPEPEKCKANWYGHIRGSEKAAYIRATVSSQSPSLYSVSPQKLVSRTGRNSAGR